LTEAFSGDERIPRYLHRDRDSIYGDTVRKRIAALGMAEVLNAKQSPWQNPLCERVFGSIRRECTDHLVPLDESHLRNKILGEYVASYNRMRCHLSLKGDAPEPRAVDALPHLGGLHHAYRRAGRQTHARRLARPWRRSASAASDSVNHVSRRPMRRP